MNSPDKSPTHWSLKTIKKFVTKILKDEFEYENYKLLKYDEDKNM